MCVCEYYTTLSALLDHHTPLKTRTRVTRPVVPWYNEVINHAKRLYRKAEHKWRKTKAVDYLLDLKAKKSHMVCLMNTTRQEFCPRFMEDNSVDQRMLFGAAKKLLGTKD